MVTVLEFIDSEMIFCFPKCPTSSGQVDETREKVGEGRRECVAGSKRWERWEYGGNTPDSRGFGGLA
jgi:hypothetical protein